ncbi:hypothetical protein KIH87_07440 [Paraneptunicella aestuarii]|uniref:hypothetical protein n=1 Tax=Paraneptunicella aestuarii TaxID=2831148 RepID=UPI001E602D99|nr:hypothetical protein [Paraneptunicella aestuarii]UAA40166.1 hypothetical protein KIH87_07440 [Paraneptunicella aestuarii]
MKNLHGKWNFGKTLVLGLAFASITSMNSYAHEVASCTTSGEKVISFWTRSISYMVSNLSSSNVDVEIKVFNLSGNRVTDFSGAGFNVVSGYFTQSPLLAPVTLGAGQTGTGVVDQFGFQEGTDYTGPVKVSWTSSSCLIEPLLVDVLGNVARF